MSDATSKAADPASEQLEGASNWWTTSIIASSRAPAQAIYKEAGTAK